MSEFDLTSVARAQGSMRQLDELMFAQAQKQHRIENPVIAIQETIETQIREFESNLEDDYELGAWLASFGSKILIIVENIQFCEPSMVIFHGRDDRGNKLQLIQHATQLNLLLNAVKKTTDEPRKRIGFHHS